MSTIKTLKGRVVNKHKTEAEWYLDTYISAGSTTLRNDPFIPLNGELIIYDPDNVYTYKRFKFGDGTTPVALLPFALVEYYTKTEIDNKTWITTEDIDVICSSTIQDATVSEVRF